MWAWTKAWSAADDGSVFGGADIQNIQTDISNQAVDLASAQTITGAKTFSGIVTFSGTFNASGVLQIGGVAVTATAAELNILDGVTATAAEINVLDGIPAGLTAVELGYVDGVTSAIQTQIDAILVNAGAYYAPDGTCVLSFDNGSIAKDLSPLGHAITLTSLAEADLAEDIFGQMCYNFDGTNDYLLIAHNALFSGMTALTIESWVYRDAGNTSHILSTKTNAYITLRMTSTDIVASIVTATGTETISANHDLAGSGNGAWFYVVITWDSSSVGKIYVNGVDKGDGDHAGNGAVSDAGAGIYLAVDHTPGAGSRMNGKITGLRMYRRKMGATEILNRYNAFK